MILIYTTCGSVEEAEKIGDVLLDAKLAVCCKMWPTNTRYLWKGKKEVSAEQFLLIETHEDKKSQVEETIKKHHSYESPLIISFPVSTDLQTSSWMEKELL